MYQLLRYEEKVGRRYRHTYQSPEIPALIGTTDYRKNRERFNWKIETDKIWEWKQKNRNYIILEYIPIINTLKALILRLRYTVYLNGKEIGKAVFNCSGFKQDRNYFQIYDKKYFCCPGNTKVIRPLKRYEWTIENEKGEIVAIIKKDYEKSQYSIEKTDDRLNIEMLMLSVMHMDMSVFSREGRSPITA